MKHRLHIVSHFEYEAKKLSEAYPDLVLQRAQNGWFKVTGEIEIDKDTRYTVRLDVHPKYPDVEPILTCAKNEVPREIDRHVYSDGTACLCVSGEIRKYWPIGSDLSAFISGLVKPFFIGQFYYDKFGSWPDTGQRPHGRPGIVEAYQEILSELGRPTDSQIDAVLCLLARKNTPKGHELCPCDNRQRLRYCHRELILKLRKAIPPRNAKIDLSILRIG